MSEAQSAKPGYTDIAPTAWIERALPQPLIPYSRLARFDRPAGIWLLLLPCLSGLMAGFGSTVQGGVSAINVQSAVLLGYHAILFAIGAILMRGAGCTINDIIDRKLDAKVERTRTRPIPSGMVSARQAAMFLCLQLAVAFVILIQLPLITVALGIASLALVGTYPMMKRITWWPQAFLGITFNWGVLMGWSTMTDSLTSPVPWILYAGSICWTIAYDTVYAHQDIEDDARVGVKSTARLFGAYSKPIVAGFFAGAWTCWAGAMVVLSGPVGAVAALPAGLYGAYITLRWVPADQAHCLKTFKAHRDVGLLLVAGLSLLALTGAPQI